MSNNPHTGDGAPWFKFWAVRWFNSPKVQAMTNTERGIFIQILVGCWIHGELTRDVRRLSEQLMLGDSRVTGRWMERWGSLLVNGGSGSSHFTVPKLDVLQDLKGKSTPDLAGEKSRGEESRGDVEDILSFCLSAASPPDQKGDAPNAFDADEA